MERRGISNPDSSSSFCQRPNTEKFMKVQCLWDESHWFSPDKSRKCSFLCDECYEEIYKPYAALYSPKRFKENLKTIKAQINNSRTRKWTAGEALIVRTLGFDTLVKIDLFENNLV